MWTRRVFRRVLKALLWCAAVVVLLSIGLRVYSAWQIPRAKRLLNGMSKLRPGQAIDQKLLDFMKAENFEKADRGCTAERCVYAAYVRSLWPLRMNGGFRNLFPWAVDHGVQFLGLRPWSAGAILTIEEGRVAELYASFELVGNSYLLIGGELNGVRRLRFPQEAVLICRYGNMRDTRTSFPH